MLINNKYKKEKIRDRIVNIKIYELICLLAAIYDFTVRTCQGITVFTRDSIKF